MNSTYLRSSEDLAPRDSSLSLLFIEETIDILVTAPFCVNHKTELIDFNRRILNHKLLTVTEQNGTATLSKTQRVHNESKFQHGGSLVQSSTLFLTVSAHVPHAHRGLIGLQSKLLVTRFHITKLWMFYLV